MSKHKITVQYGLTEIEVSIRSNNLGAILYPNTPEHIPDPVTEINRALNNPIGCSMLSDLVNPKTRVLILSDDNTRMTPTDIIVPAMLKELNRRGVSDKQIKILIALGTHRPMNRQEMIAKFGIEVVSRLEILNHDFRNPDVLYDFGTTPNGTPIQVNRIVLESDVIIGIGSIVPHHIPGFSGGAKIVQPGICGEDTTAETHLLSVRSRRSMLGIAENPVREEMDEIAEKAGVKYVFNTVLDEKGRIIKALFGDTRQAFRQGVTASRQLYGVEAPGRTPIVLASSYPCDIEFWQAHKTLYPCDMLVESGGTMIIVTPCPEGIAVTHPELLSFGSQHPDIIDEQIREGIINDKVAGALGLAWSKIRQHAEVCLVSGGIGKDEAAKLGFSHAATIEEALDKAWAKLGRESEVTVLPQGGDILPLLP
ncbi:MAG: hypothetical protein APF84_15155 [Gracilibacter sp. BRH_c7a]|nr:MAG: hypothetical protein APF84_15155 [Gracilibacter sp. BRH_c7a]